jgi:hypothetical protein
MQYQYIDKLETDKPNTFRYNYDKKELLSYSFYFNLQGEKIEKILRGVCNTLIKVIT